MIWGRIGIPIESNLEFLFSGRQHENCTNSKQHPIPATLRFLFLAGIPGNRFPTTSHRATQVSPLGILEPCCMQSPPVPLELVLAGQAGRAGPLAERAYIERNQQFLLQQKISGSGRLFETGRAGWFCQPAARAVGCHNPGPGRLYGPFVDPSPGRVG